MAGFEGDISRKQPSKAARKRVKDSFDPAALKRLCVEDDFTDYAEYVPTRDGRFYWFGDNGADVLAVGHLDTVQSERRCEVTSTSAGLLACSGALDDRLGVYTILDMLPKLGVNVDVLLTTDEEKCDSTGSWFQTDKQYKWMIEFDRGGTDVVMYQYETPELAALVENSGARVGVGSFSDIAAMDHLGVSGFNWGIGYEDYHSARSHAWLEDTFRMVARFEKFHRANANVCLPYEDDWYGRAVGKRGEWDAWIVADCGDYVDLDDEESYVWVGDEDKVVCAECAKGER